MVFRTSWISAYRRVWDRGICNVANFERRIFEEKERLYSVGSIRNGFSLSVGTEADQKRGLYNIRVYKISGVKQYDIHHGMLHVTRRLKCMKDQTKCNIYQETRSK